jgi:hypothetical protein
VFKGTLLLLGGMPVYAWLKYRSVKAQPIASAPEPPAQAA